MCPQCRRDEKDLRTVLQGAEALHEDIRRAMDKVDWDGFAERVAGAAFAGRPKPAASPSRTGRFWASLARPRWRPVFAGVLAGVLLGGGAMYVLLKPGVFRGPAASLRPSGELFDLVKLSLARREAIDYLDKSQALLLDFVQATPEAAVRSLRGGDSSLRAQNLLAKKRYLNRELESAEMAKALEICNLIEGLFLELAQVSENLTPEEAASIQRFVEDRNLLLRIRLVRKELEESEV